jgi:hypothetical protein
MSPKKEEVMKSKILIALLFAAACLPAVSNAAPINTATVRSTILSNEPDCIACSFGVPHGCYVSMQTGDSVFSVSLPAGVDEDDCSVLEEGDCIEVSGEVANYPLTTGFSMSSIQLIGSMWTNAGTSACE